MDQGCGTLLPATSVHGPCNGCATFFTALKMSGAPPYTPSKRRYYVGPASYGGVYSLFKSGQRYYQRYRRRKLYKRVPVGRGLIQKGIFGWKKVSKQTRRRRRLLSLGVTANSQPQFILDQYPRRMSVTQGFKVYVWGDVSMNTPLINSIVMRQAVLDKYGKTDSDSKICVASQKHSMLMSNATNGGLYVTVHWLKFKRDWYTGSGDINTDLLQEGFSNVGLSNSNSQVLMSSIFHNKKLMSWVDVIKTQKTFLAAGGTRMISYKDDNIKKLGVQFKTEGTMLVCKGTIVPMIVFHGTPIHDSTTESLVSTSIGAFDIINMFSIKCYNIQ